MATIVLASDKVIAACKATITHIEAEREKRDHNHALRLMHKRTSFSITKWRTTYMLYNEARTWIREESDFGPSEYAWGDLTHAKKLLRLAERGDPVTLNEEDVRVIF